jgi:hypothetical protein
MTTSSLVSFFSFIHQQYVQLLNVPFYPWESVRRRICASEGPYHAHSSLLRTLLTLTSPPHSYARSSLLRALYTIIRAPHSYACSSLLRALLTLTRAPHSYARSSLLRVLLTLTRNPHSYARSSHLRTLLTLTRAPHTYARSSPLRELFTLTYPRCDKYCGIRMSYEYSYCSTHSDESHPHERPKNQRWAKGPIGRSSDTDSIFRLYLTIQSVDVKFRFLYRPIVSFCFEFRFFNRPILFLGLKFRLLYLAIVSFRF